MIDISIFLLIAGLAFFFFLAPSKNFKQAFQALAFVLFLTLAIICFSTDEFTFTETLIREIEHSAMLASIFIDFSRNADTDGWTTSSVSTSKTNNLIIEYQGRQDIMLITHKSLSVGLEDYDNSNSHGYASKTYSVMGNITEISGKITAERLNPLPKNTYWAVAAFDTNNQLIAVYGNEFIIDYNLPINTPVFDQAVEWRLDLLDRSASDIELRIYYWAEVGLGSSVSKAPIIRVDELVIMYEEPTISTTETETRTHPILVFGGMNIAIGFIFVFLAMINLMIFMIDVVTWKRKTNSKTL